MEADRAYYARRVAEQLRAAERAVDGEVRRRHLELVALLSARERAAWRALSHP